MTSQKTLASPGLTGTTPWEERSATARGEIRQARGGLTRHCVEPQQLFVDRPTPNLRSSFSGGQKPVNADWIRLKPTNAVRSSHHSLNQWASAMLIKTIVPAKTRIAPSMLMLCSVRCKFPALLNRKEAKGYKPALQLRFLRRPERAGAGGLDQRPEGLAV